MKTDNFEDLLNIADKIGETTISFDDFSDNEIQTLIDYIEKYKSYLILFGYDSLDIDLAITYMEKELKERDNKRKKPCNKKEDKKETYDFDKLYDEMKSFFEEGKTEVEKTEVKKPEKKEVKKEVKLPQDRIDDINTKLNIHKIVQSYIDEKFTDRKHTTEENLYISDEYAKLYEFACWLYTV